jgi:hypothetical protein
MGNFEIVFNNEITEDFLKKFRDLQSRFCQLFGTYLSKYLSYLFELSVNFYLRNVFVQFLIKFRIN